MRAMPLALVLLAGCDAAVPAGQVAARVDGIEITDRELDVEAAQMGMPQNDPRVIDHLIDRKLLARAAKADLVDRTPAVQIETRRAREDILARAYAQRIVGTARPVDEAAVERFMQANPYRFAGRTHYIVDRLSIADGKSLPPLGTQSVDAVARALASAGIAFQRSRAEIDSDTLSGDENAQLAKGGRRIDRSDSTMLEMVVDKRPIDEAPDTQRARARALLLEASAATAVAETVKRLRAEATISVRTNAAKGLLNP